MQLVDNIYEKDLWCPGIAMECVTLHPEFAKFCMKKWLTIKEQIDAGPMAELWTAIEEYSSYLARDNGKKEQEIKDSLGVQRRNRILWPTLFSNNTLGEGNNLKRVIKGKVGFQNAPVTQCYYPKVDSTIKHHKKLGSQLLVMFDSRIYFRIITLSYWCILKSYFSFYHSFKIVSFSKCIITKQSWPQYSISSLHS